MLMVPGGGGDVQGIFAISCLVRVGSPLGGIGEWSLSVKEDSKGSPFAVGLPHNYSPKTGEHCDRDCRQEVFIGPLPGHWRT